MKSASPPKWNPRVELAAAAALLILHLMLGASSLMTGKSATVDEPFHVAGGLSYWTFNDYRLHPENGNLPQRLAGLGLALGGVRFPSNELAWRYSDMSTLGRQLIHRPEIGPQRVLWHARWPILIASTLICLVIWRWSRGLFGPLGGILSLALASVSPTLLAHGRLATSDTTTALFFLLACGALWKLMHRVTAGRLLAAIAAMTGLFLSKFSAPLIIAMAGIMVAARLLRQPARAARSTSVGTSRASRPRLALVLLLCALAVMVGTWAGVWIGYGGRYRAANDTSTFAQFGRYETLEAAADKLGGTPGRVVAVLGQYQVLPEAYLVGLCDVGIETRRRRAFLCGEYRSTGWAIYFPYALLVKTPLGLFGVLGCALAAAATDPRQRRRLLYRTVPLWSLLLVYWATAIASSFNIGHRHLLPTYPVMFILAGGAARWLWLGRPRRLRFWLAAGSLAAYMVAALWAWPHYLSYFNVIVGGPRQGHYHLVDSNLDWGQDLPALVRWTNEHREAIERGQFWLSYFGGGVPKRYGIAAEDVRRPSLGAALSPLSPGVYAFGATRFRQTYDVTAGPWNAFYEERYQALLRWFEDFSRLPQSTIRARIADPADPAARLLDYHHHMRITRLLSVLRRRPPDDFAGPSILIFHVTTAEITQAQYGPPVELVGEPLAPEALPPLMLNFDRMPGP